MIVADGQGRATDTGHRRRKPGRVACSPADLRRSRDLLWAKLFAEGLTVQQIADRYCVNRSTVHRRLSEMGVSGGRRLGEGA